MITLRLQRLDQTIADRVSQEVRRNAPSTVCLSLFLNSRTMIILHPRERNLEYRDTKITQCPRQ